ncbi:hypothetical protein Ciccas_005220 [Cichlidogyrus casuarinus]|uniref:Uncharacterized protein n=1 Tax=Cichlidogyrus casuarinus TaxID=1844966 RepID=A0ABD2QA71_9PLAT
MTRIGDRLEETDETADPLGTTILVASWSAGELAGFNGGYRLVSKLEESLEARPVLSVKCETCFASSFASRREISDFSRIELRFTDDILQEK